MSPADTPETDHPRVLGPIRIHSTSVERQLVGYGLAVIGVLLVAWTVENRPGLQSTVLHTALGAFAVFNGLYVAGVRFREMDRDVDQGDE